MVYKINYFKSIKGMKINLVEISKQINSNLKNILLHTKVKIKNNVNIK